VVKILDKLCVYCEILRFFAQSGGLVCGVVNMAGYFGVKTGKTLKLQNILRQNCSSV
jgi:hypothetical protein